MRLRAEDLETKFNYFGVEKTSKGEEESKIQGKINKGNRSVGILMYIIMSNNISKNAKKGIYRIKIRPLVIYGCEAWKMKQKDRVALKVF